MEDETSDHQGDAHERRCAVAGRGERISNTCLKLPSQLNSHHSLRIIWISMRLMP